MRIGWLLFCFYGLSFSAAHAATLIDLGSSSCSGSQSFDAGSGLTFSCSGDFSLAAGSLSSDTSIAISSPGSLSLDAFTLSAPSILLNAASIHIGSDARLNGQNIQLSANDLYGNSISMVRGGPLILSGSPLNLVPRSISIILGTTPPSTASEGNISLQPGADISLTTIGGSGIRKPDTSGVISLPPRPDINLVFTQRLNLLEVSPVIISNSALPLGIIASVPIPASFTMLPTGLLALSSISRRPLFRAVQ
jgi:hypothetical protein